MNMDFYERCALDRPSPIGEGDPVQPIVLKDLAYEELEPRDYRVNTISEIAPLLRVWCYFPGPPEDGP